MSVIKTKFGEYEKGEVFSFLIDNGRGLSAEILNYGGIIRRLVFNGTDVVLGRETLSEYLDNPEYFGAVVGRNVGSIPGGRYEIEGKVYELTKDKNGNNGHGGIEGFDRKLWEASLKDGEEPSVTFTYISADGEEGFPGKLRVDITYTLKKNNALHIEYRAEADKTTIFNPTNHSYFNLNGHDSGRIDGHIMKLESDFFIPNATGVRGQVFSVSGTPLDFTKEDKLHKALTSEHSEIVKCKGIDHAFRVNGKGFRRVGSLKGDISGITMEIYSDRNGVGIYTGAYTRVGLEGKNGAKYAPAHAICFETQAFNMGTSYPHLDSILLRSGEKFISETEYVFE